MLDLQRTLTFATGSWYRVTILPDFLKQGEAARLFPVLSTTSKEGRATSILLSCLEKVDEFAAAQLRTLGVRPGKRTTLQCFTEVVFNDTSQKNKRPDGLIVVSTGVQKKYFLVESKIGNAELDAAQIESYVRICKEKKLDGVITISNQYSTAPSIHPLEEVRKLKIKIPVFHWSWMSLLTTIDLMVSNEEVVDADQLLLMNELRRFLSHDSTGVKGFDRMPPEWAEVNKTLSNQGSITAKSDHAQKVVDAWIQEVKDLCLILSRLTNTSVVEKLPAAQAKNPDSRKKAGTKTLVENQMLVANFEIPDAASPVEVVADINQRSIYVGMALNAPQDKKSSTARLNWLLRQLKKCELDNCYVRANWPGSSAPTSYLVSDLINDPSLITKDKEHLTVSSFMVFGSYRLGARFGQLANFITDLETNVPNFYRKVGQNLTQWKKPAPKIIESAEHVDVDAISKEAEEF